MIITKLEHLKNKRSIVYIDGKIAFVLYKGDLLKYGLREESELDEQTVKRITEEVLFKRALLRCMHLLEKKDYTEKQLRIKMKDSYYPLEAMDYAINALKGYGYLDDERYALRYVECMMATKSSREIKRKLYEKGVDSDTVQKAFESLAEDGTIQNEEEIVRKLLEKRHYYDKLSDEKERAKQYNYLMSKGFSSSVINRMLKLDITY